MGTAPNFISKLIEKSHLDTIEHPTAVVLIDDMEIVQEIQRISNHVHIVDNVVSANLRTWRDLVLQGIAIDALPFLRTIAPKAFSEFAGDEHNDTCCISMGFPMSGRRTLRPFQAGQAKVTLLGWAQPTTNDYTLDGRFVDLKTKCHVQEQCGAATFLIEGISRACSHQLVRHRLASFGQESQRYVDMDKGRAGNLSSRPLLLPTEKQGSTSRFMTMRGEHFVSSLIEDLRRVGNSQGGRPVPAAQRHRNSYGGQSMPLHAWSHFCWLRAVDKAAQWEIRAVGKSILQLLHTVAPEVFRAHVEAL